MKTRVLLSIYHLTSGGAERAITLWAKMLTDANYDVTVLTYYPLPNEYLLDSRVTRVNLFSNHQDYLQTKNKKLVCKKLLHQYLAQHPQDILIPFLSECNLLDAVYNQKNIKVITQTIRNSPWDKEQGFDLAIRDWAIQKQGSVILQNSEQAEYFNAPLFKHVKKYIVHNTLNPDILNIKKTHYHKINKIIAVGRLVPQKNHTLMIETIRILRDEYNEIYHLDIYGTGDLQEQLQQQINNIHLNNQIKLCGRTSNIFNNYLNYDLFLIASSYEGTPNALLEAMGLGLPALAIKCRTGITELIDNDKNGFIVDSYDPHILAEKIHSINNAQQLEQIGKQARTDMLSRYTPDKIKDELVQTIENLLHNTQSQNNPAIIPPCNLKTQEAYQNYFESSLYTIRIADYTLAKQIFDHAQNTLKGIDLIIKNDERKLYYDCLCKNQFERFYQYLQTEITDTNS